MEKCKNCGKSDFMILTMTKAYLNRIPKDIPREDLKEIFFCKSCHFAYGKDGNEIYQPSNK